MLGAHHRRARFRALLATACTAVLGATLLTGAGTASAGTPAPAAARQATAPTAAGDKVIGEPGGTATGPAPGKYEQGIDDYKELKSRCPANGTVAGTAYAHCGNQWWSYDTPAGIAGKMNYKNEQGLGGTFFWELSGDTTDGELIKAIN